MELFFFFSGELPLLGEGVGGGKFFRNGILILVIRICVACVASVINSGNFELVSSWSKREEEPPSMPCCV